MARQFWDDLATDLRDPEFARAHAAETIRIQTIDSIVNALKDAAETQGMSRAALARSIGSNPAVVRRLLTATTVNPTLATVSELAAALGLRLILQPMSEADRVEFTEPMRASSVA